MTKIITLRFEGYLNHVPSDSSSLASKDSLIDSRSHQFLSALHSAPSSDLKVTITVSDEQGSPYLQAKGSLPPYPSLLTHYYAWHKSYRNLEEQTRAIQAKAARIDRSTASLRQECLQLARQLQEDLDTWLSSSSFHPICRELYRVLGSSEKEIRLLIQSDDIQIWRLPWHLWKEFQRHPNLELSFSKTQYGKATHIEHDASTSVRILALFGDRQGIDLQVDEAELLALTHAHVKVLHQPSRQEFVDALWTQAWDILFFAGHSRTAQTTGYLQINATDSLPLGDLKKALQHSVSRGLQLAIFNSCDGLGLAWELENLQIPQLVLMRELVPDMVAHQFLGNFLTGFSQGHTLYTSVRQARDRLEGLEQDFPCATWLPVICQNPAYIPPTWQSLQQLPPALSEPLEPLEQSKHTSDKAHTTIGPRLPNSSPLSGFHKICLGVGLGVGITGAVLGLRWTGLLESLELKAYDAMVHLAPAELNYDPNLLIIENTETDLGHPAQSQRLDSLSPVALNQLLTILNRAGAAVIGLDIYRDRQYEISHSENSQPVTTHPSLTSLENHPENLSRWANTESPLITICRIKDAAASKPEIKPPQNFPIESVGFSDAITDADGVLRRSLLAMRPESGQCLPSYALHVQLALRYLHQQGIELKWHSPQEIQLGQARLVALEARPGAYLREDHRGFQIPLRYRKVQGTAPLSLSQSFERVSLTEVLNGAVAEQSFRDRIVLIGTTAESYKDYHQTPLGYSLPGVVLQAHMTSQLVNAALGKQALLGHWTPWGEALWVWLWSIGGGLLGFGLPRSRVHFWVLVGGLGLIGGISWGLFAILNIWSPLIPTILAVATTYSLAAPVISKLESSIKLDN